LEFSQRPEAFEFSLAGRENLWQQMERYLITILWISWGSWLPLCAWWLDSTPSPKVNPSGKPSVPLGGPGWWAGTGSGVVSVSFKRKFRENFDFNKKKRHGNSFHFGFFFGPKKMTGFLV